MDKEVYIYRNKLYEAFYQRKKAIYKGKKGLCHRKRAIFQKKRKAMPVPWGLDEEKGF